MSRLAAMLAGAMAGAAALGSYPTWAAFGREGLVAEAWAIGLNAVLFFVIGLAVIVLVRRSGPLKAMQLYAGSGLLRLAVIGLAGWAMVRELGLRRVEWAFWIWLAAMYLLMLLVEGYWAGKGLSGAPAVRRDNGGE